MYISSNAICQHWLAMQPSTIRLARQYCRTSTLQKKRWRSHSSAICANWTAQHTRIATRYCRTHRFDAAVPMHKVSQHMQNTIAQHQQRREKSHLEPSVPLRAQIEQESTARGIAATVAQASLFFSATDAPFTRKNTMFCANPNLLKSHPWCYQFQCDLPTVTCQTQSDSQDNTEEHILYSSLLYSSLL